MCVFAARLPQQRQEIKEEEKEKGMAAPRPLGSGMQQSHMYSVFFRAVQFNARPCVRLLCEAPAAERKRKEEKRQIVASRPLGSVRHSYCVKMLFAFVRGCMWNLYIACDSCDVCTWPLNMLQWLSCHSP